MPWDEMTVARTGCMNGKPFAAAGMAVGVIGTGVCLGCHILALPVFPDGSRVGHHAEAGAGADLELYPAFWCWRERSAALTTVIFPEAALLGRGGCSSPAVQTFGDGPG